MTVSRSICVAVDAKDYSGTVASEHRGFQADLRDVIATAATGARLPHERWNYQPQGDGVLILAPLDEEPRYLDDFIEHLLTALRRRNRDRLPEARLRLRVGLAQGPTALAANGFEGEAPILACRLRDARITRDALVDSDAELVLAVSDQMFNDNVRDDRTRLGPHEFTEVSINEEKTNATAWIWLPRDRPSQTLAQARARKQPPPRPGTGNVHIDQRHAGTIITNFDGSHTFNLGDRT